MTSNFCILPFIHFATDPSGEVRYCCKSDFVRNSVGETMRAGERSIVEIWNDDAFKNARMAFLAGEKPPACQSCWNEEAIGRVSKRAVENYKYLDKYRSRIEIARDASGFLDAAPTYLDLRFGNQCNLKCRTCSPHFSSLWVKERSLWNDDGNFAALYGEQNQQNDWYKREKVRENLTQILPEIEEIYVAGGEPTLIPELLEFLRYCAESGHSRHIRLRVNSNLFSLPEKFLAAVENFREVFFAPSLDGVGEKNDWLRSPSRWSTIEKNFLRLLELREKTRLILEVNCTVSLMNVLHLHELMDFVADQSHRYDFPIKVQFSLLTQPDFMRIDNLPRGLREIAVERLRKIETVYTANLRTRSDVAALVNILLQETADPRAVEEKIRILAYHTKKLDMIRGENFARIFPELKSVFEPHASA